MRDSTKTLFALQQQWMLVVGLVYLEAPPTLNSELRLRLDAQRATWWRRACDLNLASQKHPTLTQHRHRGGREEEEGAEHLTSITGGGVGRGAFLECLALRLLSSSVIAHPRDARPCFCRALFPVLPATLSSDSRLPSSE